MELMLISAAITTEALTRGEALIRRGEGADDNQRCGVYYRAAFI